MRTSSLEAAPTRHSPKRARGQYVKDVSPKSRGFLVREDPPPTHGAAPGQSARKHELGQFPTPEPVAEFMASLFEARWQSIRLLDAGAGAGALTRALVKRLCEQPQKPKEIDVAAYEVDSSLAKPLRETLCRCQRDCERAGIQFAATVHTADFIASAVPLVRRDLFAPEAPQFNAAIVNPPYHKIRSDSPTRLLLRSAGIETSNLYTGFLALIAQLLCDGAEMVAITPRSFCNGPYFRPFRKDFLARMSLRRLHVFSSRSAAFRADNVLQENLVLHAVKSREMPRQVVISTSSGAPGSEVRENRVSYHEVVSPHDPEGFIHILTEERQAKTGAVLTRLASTLDDLGLSVSTGRVVDFRAEPFLRRQPGPDTVPLIYPCHLQNGYVNWPKADARKPNAIVANARTQELLVPSEVYVLVKRFSAKEEPKRVVACVYDPARVPAWAVGIENHLNYFHIKGHGLAIDLALGLAAFLNSTPVDLYFRQFNGHTQVNATDLRSLRYPTKEELVHLGKLIKNPAANQKELDTLLEEELNV